MNENNELSRRGFLKSAGAIVGSSMLRIGAPALAALTQAACTARDEQAQFTVLNTDEAADIAAITARIIPTTDTPGAAEAGVVHFFDQAFASHFSDSLGFVRGQLGALNDRLGTRFAALDETAQDAELKAIEDTEFFELVRVMTLFGFFGMSKHGGNSDYLSWQLVGFEGNRGAWMYPFGYYDAQVHGGDDGE
ncbi:MAG: gluconate 2-dehydrogenase subunit 3 family protein [Woeseiaceae bacterium]|nr:gluconate 2-dehydrogenase subunit 3 family protein [Woeseiaceae bacterium]